VEKFSGTTINTTTVVVLGLWLLLLLPWLVIAPLSAMAFDSGASTSAYIFVISAWTYPVSVSIVGLLRRTTPAIVLLPVLNVTAFFVSGSH
jgi:hypothetical protein